MTDDKVGLSPSAVSKTNRTVTVESRLASEGAIVSVVRCSECRELNPEHRLGCKRGSK